jgi:hypothetical protein
MNNNRLSTAVADSDRVVSAGLFTRRTQSVHRSGHSASQQRGASGFDYVSPETSCSFMV